MKANPDKFQVIQFGKTNDTLPIVIENNIIQSTSSVKLLGVSIDKELNFKFHVADLCKRAGRKLNVLIRLSKCLDIPSKLLLFHSFILSHFEYCSSVWHNCRLSDTKKIERIQERAIKYIFRDFSSSYADLRDQYNRPLMYIHRLKKILMTVFMCIHKISPSYLHNMYILKETQYDTRKILPIEQPIYNTIRYGKHSLKYYAACNWNKLDNEIKNSETIKEFKNNLNLWTPSCLCGQCDLCSLNNM